LLSYLLSQLVNDCVENDLGERDEQAKDQPVGCDNEPQMNIHTHKYGLTLYLFILKLCSTVDIIPYVNVLDVGGPRERV
jgi:hypothetical protein